MENSESVGVFCMNLSHLISPARERTMCIYEEVTNHPAVASLCPEAQSELELPIILVRNA